MKRMKRLDENIPVRRSKKVATVTLQSIVDYSDSSNEEGLYIPLDCKHKQSVFFWVT